MIGLWNFVIGIHYNFRDKTVKDDLTVLLSDQSMFKTKQTKLQTSNSPCLQYQLRNTHNHLK